MRPVAIYLDVLQGEAHCHVERVLLTIVKLKSKLRGLHLLNPASINLRDGLLIRIDFN